MRFHLWGLKFPRPHPGIIRHVSGIWARVALESILKVNWGPRIDGCFNKIPSNWYGRLFPLDKSWCSDPRINSVNRTRAAVLDQPAAN